ncbi:hypothetical protein AB6T85_00795 [Erwinia sp. ACCC 02193]|uniref:Uncharacterized protein n=1 Tax=Erwinia aeris TaxID=3239803 RepID=A0ABV4E257_9GAMM
MNEDYLIFTSWSSSKPAKYLAGLEKISVLESDKPRIWKSLNVYRFESGGDHYNVAAEYPPLQDEVDKAVRAFKPEPIIY